MADCRRPKVARDLLFGQNVTAALGNIVTKFGGSNLNRLELFKSLILSRTATTTTAVYAAHPITPETTSLRARALKINYENNKDAKKWVSQVKNVPYSD